ncbi:hypothetical protein GCM10017044_02480 [Kordiimonas sediminis]|uniref:Uncharacterized protein n=1 Tax=Kordiimonas sediminis TaxID=1735581 RepID=A0A919AJ89_9PROT|nr:hypothetical protein [Kordiimonas sediminis]GHF12088.1 hypothetical protein GCM10017044_02480 [Kordiimonas sediminis]
MTDFLHALAEGLRTKEKLLEDHNDHPAFDSPEGASFKQEYDDLLQQVKELNDRIDAARREGKDYDEHFERTINDDTQKISVAIDSWSKKIKR